MTVQVCTARAPPPSGLATTPASCDREPPPARVRMAAGVAAAEAAPPTIPTRRTRTRRTVCPVTTTTRGATVGGEASPIGDGPIETTHRRAFGARSEHHGEKETSDDAFFDPATEGTPRPPCVLRLEYWMRSEACTERKRRHVEAIDARGGYWGMEEHIERTVFGGCDAADDDDTSSAGTITPETKPSKKKKLDVALEPNMFPYECPPGVTHWTLWSRRELSPAQIVRWTKTWLRAHKPNVTKWNFDMNDNNSVDVPHYHVFLFEPPRGSRRRDADKADDVSEPRGEDEEHPPHAKNANTREDAKRSEKTRKAPRTPSPFGDEAQEPEK